MISTETDTIEIAQYFDDQAERWDAEHGPGSGRAGGFHACVDHLARACRELGRPRVLDIGCASGQHLLHLAPEIRAGVGVDISPRMIERARAAAGGHGVFRHLRFRVGDAARLAPEELGGRFDLVLFIGVLEHIPNRQRALRAAAGLIEPDGRIIVVMPSRVDDRRPGAPRDDGRYPPRIFASDRHFTAGELVRYARRAGLVAERTDGLSSPSPDPAAPPPPPATAGVPPITAAAATCSTFAVRFRRAADDAA